MFTIYKNHSPHKIRDINIALTYHNSDKTLKEVALEYGMSAGNVERIHNGLVRHISRCIGLDDVYHFTFRKNHSQEIADYLQEYKKLLEENELKTEIKLHDDEGVEAVNISSTDDSDWLKIELLEGFKSATIAIEHLKLAIRKLSVR